MKKILALALLLLAMSFSICQAAIDKTYNEQNNRATIRSMNVTPATDLDPESIIVVNLQKMYIFDSRLYDNSKNQYKPCNFFTIAIMGNAAEKFDKNMTYTVNGASYSLPLDVKIRQNDKKQTILSSGTYEFVNNGANNNLWEALKAGKQVKILIPIKGKKTTILKYTLEGKALEDMQQVVNYDLYNDAKFLDTVPKATKKPVK